MTGETAFLTCDDKSCTVISCVGDIVLWLNLLAGPLTCLHMNVQLSIHYTDEQYSPSRQCCRNWKRTNQTSSCSQPSSKSFFQASDWLIWLWGKGYISVCWFGTLMKAFQQCFCAFFASPSWFLPEAAPLSLKRQPWSPTLLSRSQMDSRDKGNTITKDGGESDGVIRQRGSRVGSRDFKGGVALYEF